MNDALRKALDDCNPQKVAASIHGVESHSENTAAFVLDLETPVWHRSLD